MRRLPATCMALGLAGVFLTVAAGSARADRDDWHHGWHGHGWHHERWHEHWRRPVYVGPRYYVPPPTYYAPPPTYYAPPPVYYGAPGVTFSFGIR